MADLAPQTFSIGEGDWHYNPKFHDFATFLGLNERDAKGVNWKADKTTREKMGQVYLWGALKADTDDHQKIKAEIYKLQRAVGINWVGKSLVDRLWQHTVFDQDFKKKLQRVGSKDEQPAKEPKKRAKPKKEKTVDFGKKEIEASVTKVKEQVKKQVQEQTKKAVQDAIQEGIKSAFK